MSNQEIADGVGVQLVGGRSQAQFAAHGLTGLEDARAGWATEGALMLSSGERA